MGCAKVQQTSPTNLGLGATLPVLPYVTEQAAQPWPGFDPFPEAL